MSCFFYDNRKLATIRARSVTTVPMDFIGEFGVEICPAHLEDRTLMAHCLTQKQWFSIYKEFSQWAKLKSRKATLRDVTIEEQMMFLWHHISQNRFEKIKHVLGTYLRVREAKFGKINFPRDRSHKTGASCE